MPDVKQCCQLEGCTRAVSTRCYCCNKNVCTRHFTEHVEAVRAQIDPLAETPRVQLDQWKADMYQLVDYIYFEKSQEIDSVLEQNKEEFVDHKKRHLEMIMKIQDDDATFEQVQLVKAQLTNVEKTMLNPVVRFLRVFVYERDHLICQNPSSDVNDHANTKTNGRPHAAQAPLSPFDGGFGCSSLRNPKPTLFSPTTSTTTISLPIFGFGAPTHGTVALALFGSVLATKTATTTTTTTSLFSFAAPTVQTSTFGSIKSETSDFSFCSQPAITPPLTVSTCENRDVTI
ncbi:unnamed protein product [Rotaria socialis]|uniref:Uncharacterized protein n=1 Tax=Rotaria socialis TaxID=392032 RepID=A0A818F372_9BILA|nr:unnamed protein product [Rotaria socialis]CAF4656033.1 unnamed protein product [Rotaria socialis]